MPRQPDGFPSERLHSSRLPKGLDLSSFSKQVISPTRKDLPEEGEFASTPPLLLNPCANLPLTRGFYIPRQTVERPPYFLIMPGAGIGSTGTLNKDRS